MRNWDKYAACKGLPLENFFTEGGDYTTFSRKFCYNKCIVRQHCLDAAMQEEKGLSRRYGLRGGLTARARERLARQEQKKAS